jgi:hypothetical protein
MNAKSRASRLCFGVVTFLITLSPQGAFARGDRVMGAASEGAQLHVKYLEKMERLDLERKQCRKDIELVVNPQLALMDELGVAGLAGPARSAYEEGKMNSQAQQLQKVQSDLLHLGKLVQQSQNKKDDATHQRHLQAFEQRMREYSVVQRRLDNQTNSIVNRSEKAVTNFVSFAKAVLQIKRSEACQGLWQDLRPQLPRNMEQALLKNRNRIKVQVASLKQGHQNFAIVATRLIERFKPMRAVALEDDLSL